MTKGQRIKLVRELRNISQTDLANSLHIKKQTLYKYENDVITNIPSDNIEEIARICNVSPAFIMGWSDIIEPEEVDSSLSSEIELQEYLEELKNREEMRMLFKLAKGATKEDVEKAVKIIEALTNNN